MGRLSMEDVLVLKLGPRVGKGAFSQVFQARDKLTGKVVAVKKSRVSLQVKRTLLRYEAQVLRTLQGHPAIPLVYAFGRFEHFEYISMELLGHSVGHIKGQALEVRKGIAPRLAAQMLSASEHVHFHGLAHRDIKPENILFCPIDHLSIRLIDFGLAYQYRRELVPEIGPNLEPDYIVGTLPYASLHAHRGVALTRRDDLESLAYTLFSILRSCLPWDKPHVYTSTPRGDRRQVLARKQAWSGARLAEGYDTAFGEFLDEIRGLGFNETPFYDRWQLVFAGISESRVVPLPLDFGASDVTGPTKSKPPPLSHIVQPGQLIYAQLMPRTTIEGYTIGQGDSSYWLDPSLSDEMWPTIPLPAIVLKVHNNWRGKSVIKVAPITRRRPGDSLTKVLLTADGQCKESNTAIVLGSDWPQDPTWCYSFVTPNTFLCDPDQRQSVPLHWKVADDTLSALLSSLDTKPDTAAANLSPLAVTRTEMFSDIYVKAHALGPDSLTHTASGQATNWESERGWFDQLDPILKRRARDDEYWCALTEHQTSDGDGKEARYTDSYFEMDFSEWREIQQERDPALSLGLADYSELDVQLRVISSIE